MAKSIYIIRTTLADLSKFTNWCLLAIVSINPYNYSYLKTLTLLFSFVFISTFPAGCQNESNSVNKSNFEDTLEHLMQKHNVPGVSIAVVEKGNLKWAKGFGVIQKNKKEKITKETMFSVGSVSKVGTALTTLRLVKDGVLDLDKDVNDYLKSWKVPENRFTKINKVTLRRIMSHTAGLTVHGFADFLPGEKLPTTVEILNGTYPAKNNAVIVNIPVGSRFRYSGGGTTVEQLVLEDVLNKDFDVIANENVFESLNMLRSTYKNPVPKQFKNIAKAHNSRGNPTALPRGYESMPENGASGLWTTPSDLSKMIIAIMKSYHYNSNFLGENIAQEMLTPIAPSKFGLGPRILKENGETYFRHGGSNNSYKAYFIGNLNKLNALIMFTNGANGNDLIHEVLPLLKKLENW